MTPAKGAALRLAVCLMLLVSCQASPIIPIKIKYEPTAQNQNTITAKIRSDNALNRVPEVTYSSFLGRKIIPTTEKEIIYIPVKINGFPYNVRYESQGSDKTNIPRVH